MSNRNFDNSVITKRIADKNIAQFVYNAMINGRPVSGLPASVIASSYNSGTISAVDAGLSGGVTVDPGGVANLVPDPNAPPAPAVVTVPAAPIITSITPGNTEAIINFTAGSDGGSAITDYDLVLFTSTGLTSGPITVSGLINGVTYTFALRAKNSIGPGPVSNTQTVTPATPPSAPTITSITAGNGTATVNFTAPLDNGGAVITNYKYSTDNGLTYTLANTTTSPITITGLTNGTTYQVKILAVNIIGDGTPSNTISVTPLTTPSAPTITSITPGNAKATVNFTAPSNNGGSVITNYKYSIDGGSTYILAGTTTSPIVISGLTNNVTYQVTIKAVNAVGDGAPSATTSVTPVPPPPPPPINGIASWANSIVSGGPPNSFNVFGKSAIDSAGNVYIIGRYTSNTVVTIGSVTLPLTYVTFPPPEANGFIIKYNSSGIAQWAINLPSFGGISSIVIDSGDNIYLACSYLSDTNITIQNANGTGQTPSAIQLPSGRSAIIKYTSAGVAVWATSFTTDINIFNTVSIAVDSTNNVYLSGSYSSNSAVTLNIATTSSSAPTPTTKTLPNSSGNQYGYLLKYDTNGNPLWSIYVQGYISTGTQVKSISIDSDNNICMIGELWNFNNVVNLTQPSGDTQTTTSFTLPAIQNPYVFLAKYTSNGVPLWSTYLYQNNTMGAPTYNGNNIIVDSDKNIYITGVYANGNNTTSVVLQNANGFTQTSSTYTLQGTIPQAAYLIKYDTNGQVLWSTYFRAIPNNTAGNSLAIDSTNNVYISGTYQTTSAINTYNANGTGQIISSYTLPATIFTPIPIAYNFIYLIKYNSSGATQWATYVGTYGPGATINMPLAIQENNLYIAGVYQTNAPNTIQVQNASGTGQTSATGITLPNTNNNNSTYLIKYN